VQACVQCGRWKFNDGREGTICWDCYQFNKEEERAWSFQEWVLTLPERIQEERNQWQRRQLRQGHRTLRELKRYLRHGVLPSQRQA
jgi:hypothetical protein